MLFVNQPTTAAHVSSEYNPPNFTEPVILVLFILGMYHQRMPHLFMMLSSLILGRRLLCERGACCVNQGGECEFYSNGSHDCCPGEE